MNTLFSPIETSLQPHLPSASQIAVAYSGGLDSTVLLHTIVQLYEDTPIIAIHVNHNLSPNAAAWQAHCVASCKALGVELHVQSVHLTANGKGLEAEARELRYAAIADCIASNALVLTGQHQQDQIETFLLQLKRGAGPKGLSAMPQSLAFAKDSLLLRPLLNCSQADLQRYADIHQLSWIEDESNLDTHFERNFLRQKVLPQITQRWPGFDKAASRSISLIAEQQQLVDELAAQDLAGVKVGVEGEVESNSLNIVRIGRLSTIRQRNLLRYWLAKQNVSLPSREVLNTLINEVILAKADANPKVQWAGVQLRRFRDEIFLLANAIEHSGEAVELQLDQTVVFEHGIGSLTLSTLNIGGGGQLRLPHADEKITVRFDVTGVSCKPQGSAHTRKLRHLFKQYKVPPWQRSRTPLIYYGEQLVAVAGLFVCEEVREGVACGGGVSIHFKAKSCGLEKD